VKYQLVGGGRTGALEISCARLARMIFNEEVGSATAAHQELRDIYPSDDEFRNSFRQWEEDDNTKATYVLRKLEIEARRVELGPNYKDLDPGTLLTLEHIFPRNPTPEWKEHFPDDDQADEAIYRLGNLCLVGRNRDLGRDLFYEKKKIFCESDLYLTRHLEEFDTWNMESIERRQVNLAKYAITAWRFQ
jgi:hypothetical protein